MPIIGGNGGGGGGGTTGLDFDTPENHGAAGNGSTDDSRALQNCISALSALPGGGVMYLDPNKKYAVGPANGGPIMLGSAVSIWAGDDSPKNNAGMPAPSRYAAAQIVVRSDYPTDAYVFDTPSTAVYNVKISGLIIATTPPSSGTSQRVGGIRIKNGQYCAVGGTLMGGLSYSGINLVNGLGCRIYNNTAQYFTQFRTLTQNEGAVVIGGTDHWVERNQCNGGDNTSVHDSTHFYRCGLLINAQSSWIIGNNGEYSDAGVKIVGDLNTIMGLRGDVNAGHGIMFEGGVDNVCTGLLVITNSLASSAAYDGVYLDANSYGNSIDGIAAGTFIPGTLMRYLVNDQSIQTSAPDGYPFNPNKIKRIKALWAHVGLDIYNAATTYQSTSDSGKSSPYLRPPSRWMSGETWFDTLNRVWCISDGSNWCDTTGGVVGNKLTAQQAYFVGGTTTGWALYQATLAIIDGHTAFGRPKAMQVTPNSTGITANLTGAIAAAVSCTPGDQLVPVVYGRVQHGTAATTQVSVTFYKADSTAITTTAVSTAACPITSAAGKCVGAAVVAPAFAASAVLNVTFTRSGGGLVSGDIFEMSKAALVPGNWATDFVET